MLVVLAMAGCRGSVTRTPAAEGTSTSFADTSRELDELGTTLQQTQAMLNGLTRQPGDDLRPQFTQVEAASVRTAKESQDVRRSADAFRARGRAMMVAWDEELAKIDRLDLRELGQRRRQAFAQKFDRIDLGLRDLQRELDPYLQGLNDLLDFLRVDLNRGALNDVSHIAEDNNDRAAVVTRQISELSLQLNDLSTQISPVQSTTAPVE